MHDDNLIIRRDGWFTTWLDGDLIMMSAECSFYLNLSGTGGRIWELLERPCNLKHLCQILAQEFDIEADMVRPEVAAFLDQLLLRKAIDVYPPTMA